MTTLEETLAGIPENPGIYKMLDAGGRIIYIGKSKCLKKRVHSYFAAEPKWEKAKKMRPFIVDVEYEVTDTHLEAMLLECRLIKTIKPYFNVMMKNDEKYFFLSVSGDVRKNPLQISHERTEVSFGPLRRRGPVEELIGYFRNLYPLAKKRGGYSCEYHVLPVQMDRETFEANRTVLAELFSDSRSLQRFIKTLEKKMQESAKNQQFERAARYRDLSEILTYICRCLHKFELFQNKEVLYRVPMKEGLKCFYIRKGIVMDAGKLDSGSGDSLEQFLQRAKTQKTPSAPMLSEKESKDYTDIIFAELEKAPEEDVMIL